MKEDVLRRAIGDIDSRLIDGSEKPRDVKHAGASGVKRISVAAALVLAVAAAAVLPGMLRGGDNVTPQTNMGDTVESKFEKGYTYSVDAGRYATYVRGRVIAEEYIGARLEEVTVTAGWVDADGKALTEEHARAEIFAIKDVSIDVAVAIRFKDELEAQLTTCYYVIINPYADPTPVRDYIIASSVQEVNGEIEE